MRTTIVTTVHHHHHTGAPYANHNHLRQIETRQSAGINTNTTIVFILILATLVFVTIWETPSSARRARTRGMVYEMRPQRRYSERIGEKHHSGRVIAHLLRFEIEQSPRKWRIKTQFPGRDSSQPPQSTCRILKRMDQRTKPPLLYKNRTCSLSKGQIRMRYPMFARTQYPHNSTPSILAPQISNSRSSDEARDTNLWSLDDLHEEARCQSNQRSHNTESQQNE